MYKTMETVLMIIAINAIEQSRIMSNSTSAITKLINCNIASQQSFVITGEVKTTCDRRETFF